MHDVGDDAEDGFAPALEGDADGEAREAVEEVGGAVEGVDDPPVLGLGGGGSLGGALFGEERSRGEQTPEPPYESALRLFVDVADELIEALELDLLRGYAGELVAEEVGDLGDEGEGVGVEAGEVHGAQARPRCATLAAVPALSPSVELPDRLALHDALAEVGALARTSRLGRLAARPQAYLTALAHRTLAYRATGRPLPSRARTFFGHEMHLDLPAGTDIYLTGGKSHDSELRLARYLLRAVAPGATVFDVGAHVGFFTLLAAELVGPAGQVQALEAAPGTYATLAKNVAGVPQAHAHALAAAAAPGKLTFYTFDALHSEYNGLDVGQHREAAWFGRRPPRAITVEATSLDVFAEARGLTPALIKIDVEGAEATVIEGGRALLSRSKPIMVMEVLPAGGGEGPHARAAAQLAELGYEAYRITASGHLAGVGDAVEFVRANGESDNVVFKG